MSLRIEICKNCRGSYDIREGDIDGAISISNYTKKEILNEIGEMIDKL